jgi:hypothetical protein
MATLISRFLFSLNIFAVAANERGEILVIGKFLNAIKAQLERVAVACRAGLISLIDAKGSTFNGFPKGACGVASDISGE